MAFPKWLAIGACAFMTVASPSAQPHFPLRPGARTETASAINPVTGTPITMLMCMNEDAWAKVLAAKRTCSLQQFDMNSAGAADSLAFESKSMQRTGDFKAVFDGVTHMTPSGSMAISMNGKTSRLNSAADFRWEGSTRAPDADIHLKKPQGSAAVEVISGRERKAEEAI